KKFKEQEEHQLLVSFQGNYFGKNQQSEFGHVVLEGVPDISDQITRTDFREAEYLFKADYTEPFNENWTLETGVQYLLKDVSNDYAVSNLTGSDWQSDPNLTNMFAMGQDVWAGYASGSYEGDKLGIKLGLRAENTNLN